MDTVDRRRAEAVLALIAEEIASEQEGDRMNPIPPLGDYPLLVVRAVEIDAIAQEAVRVGRLPELIGYVARNAGDLTEPGAVEKHRRLSEDGP